MRSTSAATSFRLWRSGACPYDRSRDQLLLFIYIHIYNIIIIFIIILYLIIIIFIYNLFIYIDYSRPTGDRDSVVQNNTLHSKTMYFKLFVLVGVRYWSNAALSSAATHQAKPQNKVTLMRTIRPLRSDLILNSV